MGLYCSHDAFHGSYSAFNRFRQVVCKAIGGSLPPHWIYNQDGTLFLDKDGMVVRDEKLDDNLIYFPDGGIDDESGMYAFLLHSDCDGEISPEMCAKVADDLEKILPKIESLSDQGGGHIKARGGFAEVTKKFIAGCRAAAAENEPLEFG